MASKKHLIQCPHCSKQFEFVAPVKKKASPEETRLFKLAKKIWLEDIKLISSVGELVNIHNGWAFAGMQGLHLKQILSKIKTTINNDKRFVYSEELHLNSFFTFCMKGATNSFYKDKDLQIYNSKYNEIISLQKTPQINGYNSQPSGQRNKYDSLYKP